MAVRLRRDDGRDLIRSSDGRALPSVGCMALLCCDGAAFQLRITRCADIGSLNLRKIKSNERATACIFGRHHSGAEIAWRVQLV